MDDVRKNFLHQLNLKREEFIGALNRLMEKQKEYNDQLSGESFTDETDQAQREICVSNNYSLIERKTRELKQIELLIRKISKNDSFGECEECGNPIPLERLLIVPETALCVSCQRDLEKLNQQRGPGGWTPSGFRSKSKKEWDDYGGDDDTVYDLTDVELDVVPGLDMDEAENQDSEEIA